MLDNVVREGGVIDAASDNAAVLGTRAAFERLAREPRERDRHPDGRRQGYDGFLIALVRA